MVSGKSYNINTNEDFVMVLASELITHLIDTFTSQMKSQLNHFFAKWKCTYIYIYILDFGP